MRHRKRILLIFLYLFACLGMSSAYAQGHKMVLVLNDGKTLEGVFVSGGPSAIQIYKDGGIQVIELNKVRFITVFPRTDKAESSKTTPATTPSVSSLQQNTPPVGSRVQRSATQYMRGPRGGCYYLSSSGRKVYVSRDLCN